MLGDFTARRTCGHFSLRTGVLLSGIVELCVGLTLWLMLRQLRPQLRIIAQVILVFYAGVGALGIVAGVRKSYKATWAYTAVLLLAIAFTAMLACEFLDILHFLPQPPVQPTSERDVLPLSAAGSVTPLNAVIKTDPKALKEKQEARVQGLLKADAAAAAKAALKKKKQKEKEAVEDEEDEDELDFWMLGERQAPRRRLATKVKAKAKLESDEQILHAKAKAGAPAKGVAEDEVSVEELPGVYSELSDEGKKLVEAQIKSTKHIIRTVCGILLMILSALRLYFVYVAGSWALNKCIAFEELEDAPDQFDALLTAGDDTSINVNQLQLDIPPSM